MRGWLCVVPGGDRVQVLLREQVTAQRADVGDIEHVMLAGSWRWMPKL